MKYILTFVTAFALVGLYTPLALAADDISVSNDNQANVSNSVQVFSNTGGNVASGGDGGTVSSRVSADDSTRTRFAGSRGANGGNAGSISTGDAFSTAYVLNDVNSTDTNIVVEEDDCGCQYDESLTLSSREGRIDASSSEESFSYDDNSSYYDRDYENSTEGSYVNHETDSSTELEYEVEEEESSHFESSNSETTSSSDDDGTFFHTESSAVDSESSSESETEFEYENEESESYTEAQFSSNTSDEISSADMDESIQSNSSSDEFSWEYDNYDFSYSREYVGSTDQDTSVSNSNSANLDNNVLVGSDSGSNVAAAGEGGTSSIQYSLDNATRARAHGSRGANGGNAASISTGTADSYSETVNILNHDVVRIRR